MRLQIIRDGHGEAAGVFIPIDEWNRLKKQYKALEDLEDDKPSKERLLLEVKEALYALKQVEGGRQKARPLKELLDEL